MRQRPKAWRERAEAWWRTLFFFGAVALAAAPLFATSMSYFGMLIVTVAFLGWVATGGWRRLRPCPLDWAIAAFLGVRIISTLTSVSPATSWKGLEKSGLLLLYYPLAHMNMARERRLGGIAVFLIAALWASLEGIAGFGWGLYRRATSPTVGYTTFAEVLAVALCLGAAAAAFGHGVRRVVIWGLSAVPLLALVLTFCRGQWLAFVAGLTVISVAKERRLFLMLVPFVLAAGMAAWLAPSGLASGRFSLGDPAFENYRDVLWRGGLETAFRRPLTGFGPETLKLVFPYQTRFYSPVAKVIGWHNDFLQLVIESGWGAAAAALWIWLASLRSGWQTFKSAGGLTAERGLGLGLVAANVVLLVSGVVGNVVTDPTLITIFAFLWGLMGPLTAGGENGA